MSSEVLEITQTTYIYKSLLAYKDGKRKMFDNQWKIWTDWFEKNKARL